MGNYSSFYKFENPRRGRQARNFTSNVPKILDLKSSSEQIFSKNYRWVPLFPRDCNYRNCVKGRQVKVSRCILYGAFIKANERE